MGFYEDIANYYELIFPTKTPQLQFIKETAGKAPKNILDIACGTGGYAIALAKHGYDVTAIDLDNKMIEKAKDKAANEDIQLDLKQGNMLTIDETVNKTFDTIYCIGNSVVHLKSKDEIFDFFKTCYKLTKSNGHIVLQIINYDRILNKDIKELPTIKNEQMGLLFERNYRLVNQEQILFQTKLSVKGNTYENTVPLIPISSFSFIQLLKSAGFKDINLFGDFNGSSFDPLNSYHLVIKASK